MRDLLYAYVWLDSASPPKEIMLQWYQNGWDHRAYWGEDKITYGTDGPSRRRLGPLPRTGAWVRLEVPVDTIGLTAGAPLTGISFDQSGGVVYWDKAGLERHPRPSATEPLGDMMWAMVVSPEFQFIR